MVTEPQPVDQEQISADFWFSRLRGRLRMEIEWADFDSVPIPYEVVHPRCWLCGEPWIEGQRCLWPNLRHG